MAVDEVNKTFWNIIFQVAIVVLMMFLAIIWDQRDTALTDLETAQATIEKKSTKIQQLNWRLRKTNKELKEAAVLNKQASFSLEIASSTIATQWNLIDVLVTDYQNQDLKQQIAEIRVKLEAGK